MAKSKLELSVETGQWNRGLREAQQALAKFTKDQGGLDQAVTKNSQKMAQFVQIMGNTKSTAATASGQMKEYRSMIERCQVVVAQLNGEDKKLAEEGLQKLIERFREAKAQADSFSQELTGVQNSAKNANGGLAEFTNGIGLNIGNLTKMGVAIGAAKLALDGLKEAVSYNVETAMNFEYSMSKLQSLTGMTGDDLNTLKRKAIELGSSTTQSASQVADAFAIIGSKRPDLLTSAYALSDVTAAAITLSEAAGMEVPEAAEALSAALNIFNMKSDEAARVINVLAAGSKLGAGSIQDLSDMTFRAGGNAYKSKMSFEEFAAACEAIRPAFGTAEDAGQAFSKFLSKLEEKMDNNCKPSVVGFQKAMENLRDKNLSANEALKIFTVNGVKAYDAIMKDVDGLKELTKNMTGTSTAIEQSSINTDNLKGSLASLSSAWEGLNLSINDSNGMLKGAVDWLTNVVNWANQAFTKLGNVKRKMDEINQTMGNGHLEGVDLNVSRIKGSAHPQEAQKAIGHEYDLQIEKGEKAVKDAEKNLESALKTGSYTMVQAAKNSLQEAKNTVEATKNLKSEFYARSNQAIRSGNYVGGTPAGEEDTSFTPPVSSSSSGKHTGSTRHTQTPAEKAADKVASAQLDYSQAIEKADIYLEKGLYKEIDYKKKMLAAQERLFDAYSDAYALTKDKRYSALLDESYEALSSLATEVESLESTAQESKNKAAAEKKRKAEIEAARKEDGTADFGILTKSSVDEYIKYLKDGVQNSTIGSDMFNAFTAKLADTNALKNVIETALNNGIDISSFNTQGLWDKILSTGGDAISNETLQAIVDEINSKISDKKISLNFATGEVMSENVKSNEKKGIEDKEWYQDTTKVVNVLSQVASGLQSMGVKLPEWLQKSIAALQGALTVVQGASAIISVFSSGTQTANTAATTANTVAIGALTTALIANTTAVSANSVASLIPFNNGGFLHAANGVITGSHFSGDVQPLMVNAGEGVINQADQAALFRAIKEGNFGGGGSIQSVGVRGTDLLLCLNNELRSQGKPTL